MDPQRAMRTKIKRHKQATDAAIAVQERVDGLGLDVEESRIDQRGQSGRVLVHEPREPLMLKQRRFHLI